MTHSQHIKRVTLHLSGDLVNPSNTPDIHPGVHGSTKSDGRVYISAFKGAGADGYKSSNHGATMSEITTVKPDINPDEQLAGEIHVAWDSNPKELLVYHGKTVSGERRLIRIEINGSTKTDISPSYGGEKYGPWKGKWQIAAWSGGRNYILACLGNADHSLAGVWISRDGGSTWTTLVTPTADGPAGRYERGVIAGDDHNILYLWGTAGLIGYSTNGGATIDDRTGNISIAFPATAEIVGIAGG